MAINEAGQIDYRVLLESINWRRHRVDVPPSTINQHLNTSSGNWQGNDDQPDAYLVQAVRVDALMSDIGA